MPAIAATRKIITERVIHAPRELVYRAWTDPAQVLKWWGPDGFTNTMVEMDVRPGGTWKFVMHGPDGKEYDNHIVFVELKPPERIVYDHLSTPWFRSVVTFADVGGKTRLRMAAEFKDEHDFEMAVKTFGAEEGGKQTLGRLATFIETGGSLTKHLDLGPLAAVSLDERDGVHTITFVRELPHAPERVWKALTDPAHLKEWAPFTTDRDLGSPGPARLTMSDGGTSTSLPSTVRRADAPRLLEYTWDDDLLVWALEPIAAGTRLTLRHSMKDRSFLAGVSAGWHICLAVADLLLQDRPFGAVNGSEAKKHGWDRLNEAYAAKLGVPKMVH